MSRRPSLLFVNQHYYPDFASTGQHLTDLAEYLAEAGYEVSVLCSQGRYLAGSLDVPKREVHNGVSIRRVRATSFGRGTHLGRLVDYASFYLQVLFRLVSGRRHDYVVMLTTPPLLGFLGSVARKLRGQRYGIWSMDLHPDAEVAIGMLREEQPITKMLHALNDAGYRNADFVVDLGVYMKQRIEAKGVAPERLHTVPVWSRQDEIEPLPREENPLLREWGLEDKFVVMYSGNAGLAHRFDEVLDAMMALRDHPDIFFLFVGGGPRKQEVIDFATAHGIENFRYLDYLPREQLRYSLSAADMHLLTLRGDMAGIAVPGKLYGIMAAGRPVLMVGPEESEPAQTIIKERVGAVVDPDSTTTASASIQQAIQTLYENVELREEQGMRARAAFLRSYEQSVACAMWDELIQEVGRIESGRVPVLA